MKGSSCGVVAWFIGAAFLGVCIFEYGLAHVPGKEQLFYALSSSRNQGKKGGEINFEQQTEKGAGYVVKINGIKAFNEFVIRRSSNLPVVVKICSEQNEDSKKVMSEFQTVAKRFEGNVSCIALDLFSFHENYQIVSELMMRENIAKLDLPLFLFFKDGTLYRTSTTPVAILHGFYTHENLEAFITQKFFNSKE